MRKIIIGVMGPGDDAVSSDIKTAYALGKLIAQKGWIVLSGGRNVGVMDAVSRGAASVGGLTIGILPTAEFVGASKALDIVIATGMGDARNNINVLSSDVVVVCGMNPGTASEVALAIKAKKPLIFINANVKTKAFFTSLHPQTLLIADDVDQVITMIDKIISGKIG